LPVPVAWHREKCFLRSAGIAALKDEGTSWHEVLSSDDSRVIRSAVEAGTAITVMAEGTVPDSLAVMLTSSALPPLGKACVQLLERPGQQSEAWAVARRELIRAFRGLRTQVA
jgi:DNA-binding transcriptional LysR family regulator